MFDDLPTANFGSVLDWAFLVTIKLLTVIDLDRKCISSKGTIENGSTYYCRLTRWQLISIFLSCLNRSQTSNR